MRRLQTIAGQEAAPLLRCRRLGSLPLRLWSPARGTVFQLAQPGVFRCGLAFGSRSGRGG